MTGYDWSQFHVHMYYLAPIGEVFERFSTPGGLESFYVKTATITSPDRQPRDKDERFVTGDLYDFRYVHDFGHDGEILAIETDTLVSFTFGVCQVDLHFRELDGATEVDLHQTGCPLEDPGRAWMHLNCRSYWIYFMTNLRSVLTDGPDLRDYDNPEWNDSVSIGWVPE